MSSRPVAKHRQPAPVRRPVARPTWHLWAIAAIVVAGVVAIATVLATAGAGSKHPAGSATTSSTVPLPAGTVTADENDHTHTTKPVHYDHDPPMGGAHDPTPQNCGVYDQPVANEHAVHSLEHGSVWITYQPSLPADQVDQLRQLVTGHYMGSQRYLLLSPYPDLPHPIVASAWGAQLGLDSPDDPRLLAFIEHFQGGNQGGEGGGYCTLGVGTPVA